MTVTVYVWLPHGYDAASLANSAKRALQGETTSKSDARAVGHTSLEIRSAGLYISWWPNQQSRDSTLGKIQSGLWGVKAINHASYDIDKDEEGGRTPIAIDLTGLDERKIQAWWKGRSKTYWSLSGTNCSQMVIDALREGGADKYLQGNRFSQYYQGHSVVWRPGVVLDYARAVRSGMTRH